MFTAFLRLGVTSFGGPIAHLGYFRREFVDRRRWLSEAQFSQLLAMAQFLPGPASSQLGFAIGLERAGWRGGLAAFAGFTLPSVLLLFAAAVAGASLGGPWWTASVHGLKLVAVVVVADGLWRMARQLTPDGARLSVAALSATTVLWLGGANAQMLALVLGAAAGLLLASPTVVAAQASEAPASTATGGSPSAHRIRGSALAIVAFVLLLAAALSVRSAEPTLLSLGAAFVRAGSLVFGGGHVVLPLLEESVVSNGWMNSDVFLSGYGAAQAVPGPMFSLTAYLGALTPWSRSGLSLAASAIGASVATLAVFTPGFLLVAAALPLWRRIGSNAIAARGIAGVNAAVVGLLAAALYDPVLRSGISGAADVAVVAIGFVLHRRLARPALWLVLYCVLAGLLLKLT